MAFVLLGAWYWWEVHGVVKFKTKVEQALSENLQGTAKIKLLTAPLGWPFKIQVFGLKLDSKKYSLQASVDQIALTVSIKSILFKEKKVFPNIDVQIKKALVKIYPTTSASAPSQNTASGPSALPQNLTDLKIRIPQLQNLAFHLNLSDSQIEFIKGPDDSFLIHGWNAKIDLDSLSQPLKISQNLNALIKFGQMSFSLPITIDGQTELKNGRLDLLGFRTKVINIESLISGYVSPSQGSFLIQAKTSAPDLSKIPLNLPEFPLSAWKGSLSFDIKAAQAPANPLNVSGSFLLKDFQSQLRYFENKEGIELEGPLKASAQGQFQFVNRTPSLLYLPNLQWALDLTAAKIKYKDLFYKHENVELLTEGELGLNQYTQIKKAQLKFYGLTANASGSMDTQKNANISFEAKVPSLRGFESFFPFLSSTPLAGSLQTQMQLLGPLTDFKNLKVDLKKFSLSQGQGKISFKNETLNVEGPFKVDVSLSGVLNKTQVEQVQLSIQSRLEGVSVQSKKFFQDLKLGNYQALLRIKGQLNPKDFMQSPLIITGTQEIKLPLLALASSPTAESASPAAPPVAQAPEAFMKDEALLRGVDLNTKVQIQEFRFNDLKASGINVQARVKNKMLSVVGELQSLFEGKLKINSSFIPLTVPDPSIAYNISLQNIQAEPALLWLSPKTKDLMKGKVSLDVQGRSFLPASPRFLTGLSALGKLQMKDGFLNSLPFEKMAKEALAKIPGIGQIKNSPGPLRTDLMMPFSFAQSILSIADFVAVTPRKEEMRLNGKISLDLNADLVGQVALVDAPVSGSFFEANSDAMKRLVVPIKITGNLMKPQLSFAEETIKTMLQKTLDYEKGKLRKTVDAEIGKAKKQAEDQLKKEATKKVDEIKEKVNQGLQKGIQDLLGR